LSKVKELTMKFVVVVVVVFVVMASFKKPNEF
jgi:hypothetical protein